MIDSNKCHLKDDAFGCCTLLKFFTTNEKKDTKTSSPFSQKSEDFIRKFTFSVNLVISYFPKRMTTECNRPCLLLQVEVKTNRNKRKILVKTINKGRTYHSRRSKVRIETSERKRNGLAASWKRKNMSKIYDNFYLVILRFFFAFSYFKFNKNKTNRFLFVFTLIWKWFEPSDRLYSILVMWFMCY